MLNMYLHKPCYERLYIGLDAHSEKTFATVSDWNGRVVAQMRMVNDLVSSFLKFSNV